MKEATGTLNSTLIVVVAIGVLSAFFYMRVWPEINSNYVRNMNCSEAICDGSIDSGGMIECHVGSISGIMCPYKG